ncbi:MAG TPA: LysM peptidoglycan-binding domain-containing protein [Pirellulales bacterium]
MESLKPILLFVVLGGVGYGVYVALNHAPPPDSATSAGSDWNKTPAKADGSKPADARPAGSTSTAPFPTAPAWNSGGASDAAPQTAGAAKDSSTLAARADNALSGGLGSGLPFGVGSATAHPAPTDAPNPTVDISSAMPTTGENSGAKLDPNATPDGKPVDQVPTINNPNSTGSGLPTNVNSSAVPDAQMRHDYESSMRSGQTLLKQGKLVEALREFSRWYDHPAVSPEDQAILLDMLSQISGTVIYSREHWLAPPYVVRTGDTLETVAQQYQVPWQLLAKINGIENASGLIPGEKLKVVRGPFQAQLNRKQDTLTVFVDGLYAGRFKVQGAGEVMKPDGEYPVAKFPANHPSNTAHLPYISFGGDLHLTIADGPVAPNPGTLRISQHDMDDVFDILSERSQISIRR